MKTDKKILESNRRWKANNPDKVKASRRKTKLQEKYGISVEKYEEMLQKQEECCNICKRHQSEFKVRLSVDHCHKTGAVRGLLCSYCNRMLGLWQDDAQKFKRAAEYLTAAQSN